MTAIHETAYPRLKSTFSVNELEINFTPTENELILTKRMSSTPTQLGFMITLKCYQCLGYPIAINKVPSQIKLHIAQVFNLQGEPLLDAYYKSKTRKRHIKVIRDYLQVSSDKVARKECMKKAAIKSAYVKENLADIVNDMIEELIKARFELPAFPTLLRLARASRKIANEQYYRKVMASLSLESKELIDNLFYVNLVNETSNWHLLKQEPKGPTASGVRIFIEHLKYLKKLRQNINTDINFIPSHRVEQFVSEAISMDAADMRKLTPNKRYSLAVILIIFKTSSAIDDITTILIRWIKKLHSDGKQSLDKYRLEHAPETDTLINFLYQILIELKESKLPQEQSVIIEKYTNEDADKIILRCQNYMAYSNDNYLSFMVHPYNNKRYLIFQLLGHLEIKSASQDCSLEQAFYFIKSHKNSHKEWLDINYQDPQGKNAILDLTWLPEKWFKIVTGRTKGSKFTQINRKYYELAILSLAVDDLNCGDVYVEGANTYDNPNKQLITWEQFYQEIDEYCDLVRLPSKPDNFIAYLKKELHTTVPST
ncbi:DUF4158 domain-containing protein [Holosporaceae bacterium 'Namur']|nr:DUF4158 domain-containing protein [Holosporaceae bacterium 'Namur']